MPKPVLHGHDDSAYGGQKFDVEKSQFPEDAAAPELQLNRKGLGNINNGPLKQDLHATLAVKVLSRMKCMFLRCKVDWVSSCAHVGMLQQILQSDCLEMQVAG